MFKNLTNPKSFFFSIQFLAKITINMYRSDV